MTNRLEHVVIQTVSDLHSETGINKRSSIHTVTCRDKQQRPCLSEPGRDAFPRRYARPWRKGRVLVDGKQRAAEALEAELAVVEGEELAGCRKQAPIHGQLSREVRRQGECRSNSQSGKGREQSRAAGTEHGANRHCGSRQAAVAP